MSERESTRSLRATARIAIVSASLGVAIGFLLARVAMRENRNLPASSLAPGSTNTATTPPVIPAPVPAAIPPTVAPEPVAAPAPGSVRATLATLLAVEPRQALERALAEAHLGRRRFLVTHLVRHWAAGAPEDALQWALARPAGERESTLLAVISGAVAKPDDAVFLVSQLCASEPGLALERGSALIAALAENGNFSEAARFAQSVAPAHREAWIGAAFARWADSDPQAASRAALAFSDPAQRDLALRATITGWAPNEPASLAEFAVKLPSGETRTYALGEAMRQWIDADPVAAAAWIERFEPTRELDTAVAAIAQQPYLAERRPDVALSWAESIVDRGVRASALAAIVQSWGQRDPAAARKFLASNRDLSDEERKDLLNVIGR